MLRSWEERADPAKDISFTVRGDETLVNAANI